MYSNSKFGLWFISMFQNEHELHQKYKTEFGLSLAEKAKIVKALKIQ